MKFAVYIIHMILYCDIFSSGWSRQRLTPPPFNFFQAKNFPLDYSFKNSLIIMKIAVYIIHMILYSNFFFWRAATASPPPLPSLKLFSLPIGFPSITRSNIRRWGWNLHGTSFFFLAGRDSGCHFPPPPSKVFSLHNCVINSLIIMKLEGAVNNIILY